MKVKLGKEQVLEVTAGEGNQEVRLKVKGAHHSNFCTLEVAFAMGDTIGAGNSHFTFDGSIVNTTRLTVFGHSTDINLPDFP